MATIVTRTGKGSALTFAEGDANFTNLNNDKLESVIEDTAPQLGGDLDVNDNKIVSTNGSDVRILSDNKLYLQGQQWPYNPPTTINGTVTTVDTVRDPNVLELSNIGSIASGDTITFTGSDVTTAGLVVGTEYQVNAVVNGNEVELAPAGGGGTISFSPLANPTDFNYSVSSAAVIANNSKLTINNGIMTWAADTAPALSLDNLTDVNASGATNGQILTYNGSDWNATTPAAGGGGSMYDIDLYLFFTQSGLLENLKLYQLDNSPESYWIPSEIKDNYGSTSVSMDATYPNYAVNLPIGTYRAWVEGFASDKVYEIKVYKGSTTNANAYLGGGSVAEQIASVGVDGTWPRKYVEFTLTSAEAIGFAYLLVNDASIFDNVFSMQGRIQKIS